MKRGRCLVLFVCCVLGGCTDDTPDLSDGTSSSSPFGSDSPSGSNSLALGQARRGFTTRIIKRSSISDRVPKPPEDQFRLVRYPSPAGSFSAYLSKIPADGQLHPAIIWITGGDFQTIGDVWSPSDPMSDQSAAVYRNSGIVMMFPSLRGGNARNGTREGFYGEVDDVIAAGEFLARQPGIDSKRIYLGGHSTGGTLVLLVAETSANFRAYFSFGPVHDPAEYGPQFTPYDTGNKREAELRSPIKWLDGIVRPTFVIEGTGGNIQPLRTLDAATSNPKVRFLPVPGRDHFDVLGNANAVIARKILRDTGPKCNISLTETELRRGG